MYLIITHTRDLLFELKSVHSKINSLKNIYTVFQHSMHSLLIAHSQKKLHTVVIIYCWGVYYDMLLH